MAVPGGLGPGVFDSCDGPQSNKSLHRGTLRFETTNPNHKMIIAWQSVVGCCGWPFQLSAARSLTSSRMEPLTIYEGDDFLAADPCLRFQTVLENSRKNEEKQEIIRDFFVLVPFYNLWFSGAISMPVESHEIARLGSFQLGRMKPWPVVFLVPF